MDLAKIAATMLTVAKGEVGYHEGRSGGHWNNREKYAAQVPGLAWVSETGGPWCAVFVSWVVTVAAKLLGMPELVDLYPRTASTDAGAAWFKQRGQWSEYPAVLAQVFFGTNGDMYHTGLVYDFDDSYVYTVEGNTNTSGSPEGDGVYLKKHLRTDPHVQGYGYPKGIVTRSADLKFKAPVTPKPPAPAPTPSSPTAKGYRKVAAAALLALAAFLGVLSAQPGHNDGRPIVGQTQTVNVQVWNERSFPVMDDSAYTEDFNHVLPGGGPRVIRLHSEMSGLQVSIFKRIAARLGLRWYGVRKNGDTAISTKGLDRGRAVRIKFADKPAGPASPARVLTLAALKVVGQIATISAHPPNGCFPKNRFKSWYSARCEALRQSIKLLHRVVHYLVRHGYAVLIGGDFNRRKAITWMKGQSSATGNGFVQLAAIDSENLDLTLSRAKRVPFQLHTDHPVLQSQLTVTAR